MKKKIFAVSTIAAVVFITIMSATLFRLGSFNTVKTTLHSSISKKTVLANLQQIVSKASNNTATVVDVYKNGNNWDAFGAIIRIGNKYAVVSGFDNGRYITPYSVFTTSGTFDGIPTIAKMKYHPIMLQPPAAKKVSVSATTKKRLYAFLLTQPFIRDERTPTDKTGNDVVYVVADPNCIWCKKLWDRIDKIVDKTSLREIRWVSVGFLKPSSAIKAQTIMTAKDPFKAVQTNEEKFDVATESGGVPVRRHPISTKMVDERTKTIQTIMGNNFATPLIVHATNGGKIHMVVGYPTDEEFDDFFKK